VKTRVSCDTSFFVSLLKGNKNAVSVWEKLIDMKIELVISTVVLFELRRLSLKEKFEKEKYEVLERALIEIAEIINFDKELALKAAAISHGTGLAARDAIIYTTAKEAGCKKFYTADSDFERVKGNKKVKIEFI